MRVTLTSPESEYSATPMPGRNAISVIRVGTRLNAAALERAPRRIARRASVLERIKPVGYHTWANDTLLALFVLGSPNTLQLASTTSGPRRHDRHQHRPFAAHDEGRAGELRPQGEQ